MDFQENAVWKSKFIDLNLKFKEQEVKSSALQLTKEREPLENKPENLIFTEWNSLADSFATMKTLALAMLTMFGSSFSSFIFIDEFHKINHQESPMSGNQCCMCETEDN